MPRVASGGGFAFGPFQFDTRARRLERAGTPVHLTHLQGSVLSVLIGRAGQVVSKNELMDAAWNGVTVDENGVEQVVSQLRRILDRGDLNRYIQTAARRGYSFAAPVTHIEPRRPDVDFRDVLAPHRALMDGRAAIETLERDEILRARSTFEALLRRDNDNATFHVGMANACVLLFEATRADPAPDLDALNLAVTHAREACRLDPTSGEAWATLGFVLEREGEPADALAALRHAVGLEPDNWRHHLRLAYCGWGEERMRAARRALQHSHGFPMAHWLVATVYVARGAVKEAEAEIDAALVGMAEATTEGRRFSVVAVHLLKGLLCLARGADEEGIASLERELALEPRGQLYARECCANAWYAIGAWHLRHGDKTAARAAFDETLARVPLHSLAHAGLAVPGATSERDRPSAGPAGFEAVLARAVLRVASGDESGAAEEVATALAAAPPGSAGWLLPIEPLLNVARDPTAWTVALATLRTRAW